MSTLEQYVKFVKAKQEPEVVDKLPGGGSVGWIGSKNAKKVLGIIPGGAFIISANKFQLETYYSMYLAGVANDSNFALAILAYG